MIRSGRIRNPWRTGLSSLLISFIIYPLTSAGFANAASDPISVAWRFQQSASNEEFAAELSASKQAGFLPVNFETDRTTNRFISVWQKNTDGRAWASFDGLSETQFQKRLKKYSDLGYRLSDQNIEVVANTTVYSMIMVQNIEGYGWQSYSGLSESEFARVIESSANYQATDITALELDGEVRYSLILVEKNKGTRWNQHKDLSESEYTELDNTYRKHGFHVVDIDCYSHLGKLKYAAIWQQSEQDDSHTNRHQLSLSELHNQTRSLADQGMRMIDVELCPATRHSHPHYATVWQKNDSRYHWSGKPEAIQILDKYVSAADIPGASAVVVHDGKILFRAGSGYVDSQQRQHAHSGTVYRLASIAKALVGTLAFDLAADGMLDLDIETRQLLPNLSASHTHTLRHLLTNTGCVKGYTNDGLNDNATDIQYSTSINALNNHLDGALKTDSWIIDDCSLGEHHYSTHGYTILTAALEAATGESFTSLIESRLTHPLQLKTLKVEDRKTTLASGNYACLTYKGNQINNADYQNPSWKAGGSGMESSALDLARFADAVVNNYYFSSATLDAMWSGGEKDSQYHGWSLVKDASVDREIEKGGVNQGTDVHLRIDRDSGITVVAMTNSMLPKVRTPDLTEKLMALARNHIQSTDRTAPVTLSVVEQ